MTIAISAAFDSGNIDVLGSNGASFDLAIAKDRDSDFYQWFHFRLTGAKDVATTLRLTNAGGSAYPGGWVDYGVCVSADRQHWTRHPTSFADGVLTIDLTPATDSVWLAYFAPYSMERHHDLVARIGACPGVSLTVLGHSLEGRPIDCLSIGDGPLQLWAYGRQHPGESMAEWWMEGALDRLVDVADPVARRLRALATLRIVPNMNPDGALRGHLRTNFAGVNLNREWHSPTFERSPEVACVLARMRATGVDLAIDVHGDEALPHVFIAGFEGIPNITDRQLGLLATYKTVLARLSPDFQTRIGYPPSAPGKANLTMSTNAIANEFGCLAMTLEMPFKDAAELPDPVHGWSPERSAALGRDCIAAMLEVAMDLR